MQGLKIYTRSGEAPTTEEIEFAHRVANTHKDLSFGVITMTDPTSGVIVEYHADKKIVYTSGDVGAYFGYDAAVDMRCWCRGIVLAETSSTEPNYRSAVFLTDGTELASAPISSDDDFHYNQTLPIGWFGGSNSPLATFVVAQSSLVLSGSLNFIVPEDACIPPTYDGEAFMNTSTYKSVVFGTLGANDYMYKGIAYTSFVALSGSDVAEVESFLDTFYISGQSEALTREHTRRKKCSDGQLVYLRNGFLSPEFDRFIKAYHPISTLLRRDIPMQIISNPAHTLINEERDGDGLLVASTYECRLTLKYETASENVITSHEKEFVGQVRFTEYTATYTNYPLLGSLLNGEATPVYQVFRSSYDLLQVVMMFWVYYRTGRQIVHDESSNISSLFCELNGTLTSNDRWNPTDEVFHGGTNYVPGETVQSSYGDLNISHPQFLLDYIAASKPIEKELDIDGNKVPVTPSTDWLSSRLAHNEVVTIVPLSFVNADGVDRGLYPYSRTDEVPAQVKLVGYAKVKYNYFTGSFTFVSWTEFTAEGSIKHDGNATYDAETNPTSVNVGGTTYTLQPKYFDYNTAWETPNCVCIAGKTPWTDTKAAYKTQKSNIADVPPEGYTPTAEELLYQEVRKAIK